MYTYSIMTTREFISHLPIIFLFLFCPPRAEMSQVQQTKQCHILHSSWKANLTTKNLLKQYKNFIISKTQESEWQTCTMEGKCILEGNVLFLWIQGFPSFTQLFLQDIAYPSFLHRNCFQLLPVICWQHLWYCDGFKRLAHLIVLSLYYCKETQFSYLQGCF